MAIKTSDDKLIGKKVALPGGAAIGFVESTLDNGYLVNCAGIYLYVWSSNMQWGSDYCHATEVDISTPECRRTEDVLLNTCIRRKVAADRFGQYWYIPIADTQICVYVCKEIVCQLFHLMLSDPKDREALGRQWKEYI